MRYFADCVPSRAALPLTNSNTSAILLSTLLSRFCKRGTDRKKLTFSSILCRPVRIIICWNARRSKTHTRELGFRAEMHKLECLMSTRKGNICTHLLWTQCAGNCTKWQAPQKLFQPAAFPGLYHSQLSRIPPRPTQTNGCQARFLLR